jgi:sugar lactone lactonase YvrE
MTGHHVVVASDAVHELAEGPRWDDATQTLSWVDIRKGQVFQGVLADDAVTLTHRYDVDDTVGAALPSTDRGLIVAAHDRLVAVAADGRRRATGPVIERDRMLRLNDAAVDPLGRVLVGSLATDHRSSAAALFRLEHDGSVTTVRDGLDLANGIGWSPDGGTIYLADSMAATVWKASYDVDSGEPRSWSPLITVDDGLPDRLCVDTEGRLWVAMWNGARVACFAPTGELLETIAMPVPHVTAVAFVGPHRDRLLVTSARDELDDEARARYPDSGRLFLVDVTATGLPTNRWRAATDGPGWHDTPSRPDSPLAPDSTRTFDSHHSTPEIP